MRSIVIEGPSRQMSALDAAFLHFEKPHAPLTIGCAAVLEGPVSPEEVLCHLDEHLRDVPRFSQRVSSPPLALSHPSWLPDRAFDLRNHVHRMGVPRPGGQPELCEAVAGLMERPLDRGRPLWEAHLLDGLADDRSAVLHRVHHCMLDGVAGAGVLDTLLDREPGSRSARSAPRPGVAPEDADEWTSPLGLALSDAVRGAWQRSLHALHLLRHPDPLRRGLDPALELSGWALRHLFEAPHPLPWNGPIGPRRSIAFTRFPLEQLREIRAARGCTVNDVVLSILAGGVRRYLASVGIDPERQPLLAAVPVSVRTPLQSTALGNRLGMFLVPLVLGPEEEPERLELTAAITRRLKQSQDLDGMTALLSAADLLPPPLVAWLGHRARLPSLALVIATNVRGPESPRYLAGRRIESLYPIVPLADGLGLGLAVLSYAGSVHVGLVADAARVPDLEKLRAGIEETLDRLVSYASSNPP